MKKVLFATTALIATGSVAAADVTFGGWGRFGILYSEQAGADGIFGTADDTDSTELTHRFRLQVDASAESDSGIVFGARTRIQVDATATGGGDTAVMSAARFFARSGGLELGVGNIFGALDSMPGMYPIDLGLTGLGYDYTPISGFDSFDSTGAGTQNGVEVMYSAGDLQVHLSYSDAVSSAAFDSTGDGIANAAAGSDQDRLAAHIAYTFSGWTVALGLQDSNNAADTELALSVGGSVGVADVNLAYADNGTAGDAWALSARFDVGAATNVEVYVADSDTATDTGYGVDFNHDMGGGTSLRGGIAKRLNGTTRADFGVRFNF